MAFFGGVINAVGFFSVARYTSHMSGELANIADTLYLGSWDIALASLLSVIAFILGAAHSSWTIIWSKKHRLRSSYALSMWIEAFYLIVFGLIGYELHQFSGVSSPLIILMCFIMGMHNTVLTILSNGIIRTTHMTGHVTDIGIEFSKFIYNLGLRQNNPDRVPINIPKVKLLFGIIISFVFGGIIGAVGYFELGYKVVLPIAFFLLILGFTSIGYDIKVRYKLYQYKKHRKHANKKIENSK